jgi:RNA polymerase primary sigma factor
MIASAWQAELDPGSAEYFDVTRYYFTEVTQHSLLSPESERKLTWAVKRARTARQQLSRQRLSMQQRRELEGVIAAGQSARDELVKHNARLVTSIARNYQHCGLPLLDLIQEGNLGLLKAIERFNPARGLRLSTYATWWIQQAVRRAATSKARAVRVPEYLQVRLHRLRAVEERLRETLGRAPYDEELATALGITVKRLAELRSCLTSVGSLDISGFDDSDETWATQLPDRDALPLEDQVAQRDLRETCQQGLEQLSPRQALVVQLRYGLTDQPPQTLDQIARRLRLSRERVRQIEAESLSVLRMQSALCQLYRDCYPA